MDVRVDIGSIKELGWLPGFSTLIFGLTDGISMDD